MARIKLSSKIRPNKFLFGRASSQLTSQDLIEARDYIKQYWTKVTRYHPKDDDSLLGLPNPYVVPSCSDKIDFDFNEMYYWDSYFIAQGLLDESHRSLIIGILDNLIFLFNRFRIIPNASRTYLTGRSQPPFLTSFIFDVYQTYNMDLKWLQSNMKVAQAEYETVWMGSKQPNNRLVYKGLSRYYDINMLHDLAEAESGWDMTPRFNHKALNYLPIDLNCLLYKYEMDFARAERLFKNNRKALDWEEKAPLEKRPSTN